MDVTCVVGGITGVFDVEEVVALLRDDNAQDICVIHVPQEVKYVDYLVIVTGRSTRHIRAMAAYIKWVVSWFHVRLSIHFTNCLIHRVLFATYGNGLLCSFQVLIFGHNWHCFLHRD